MEPVVAYDKCIDVLDLNENYLNCIFMNINKNVENLLRKLAHAIYRNLFQLQKLKISSENF